MGLEFRLWFRSLLTKHTLLTTLSAWPLINRGWYFCLENYYFFWLYILIQLLYTTAYAIHKSTGAYGSCHWATGRVHPGQDACSSQGWRIATRKPHRLNFTSRANLGSVITLTQTSADWGKNGQLSTWQQRQRWHDRDTLCSGFKLHGKFTIPTKPQMLLPDSPTLWWEVCHWAK